jgi:hypothetical protein
MKLWIDDDASTPGMELFRYPPDNTWLIATSVSIAKALVEVHGFPEELGLDHDLGNEKVMNFLYWLEEKYPESMPPKWSVHSMNPEGAKNITAFMDSWARSRML